MAGGGKVQNVGDGLEVKVKVCEELVVVDVEGVNGGEVNSLEGGEGGVRNNNVLRLGDTREERKLVERVQSDQGKGADLGELGEGNGIQ